MPTENIDPETDLQLLQAVALERRADERGRLMGAAFTVHGTPVMLVFNTN
jgi:hypothetical protein